MNAAINDKEARKFWEKVYLAHCPGNCPSTQEHVFAHNAACAGLNMWMLLFGDENTKREWEEFKQERAAKNTPE